MSMSFSMPEWFGDRMVLQQGMPVPIWGTAEPRTEVAVDFAGQRAVGRADAGGGWRVVLEPMVASAEPRVLTVDTTTPDGETVCAARLTDVLVGEVWFFSGQSNAAMGVRGCASAEETVAAADLPQVRMFVRVDKPRGPTCWTPSSPAVAAHFPGVPFFFARALQRDEQVPVGMIVCAMGGTMIETWTSREAMAANPKLREEVLEKWETNTTPKALADELGGVWEEALNEADGDAEQARSTLLNAPGVDPAFNFERYRIADFAPLALRGFAWYQGESNAYGFHAANRYREQLKTLIQDWRGRWQDGDDKLFLVVQLPHYPPAAPQPPVPEQINPWSLVMEAQWQVQYDLPNVHTAVTIDLGAEGNIHPPRKAPVGERLSLLARRHGLGRKIVSQGPVFGEAHFAGDGTARLRFDTSGTGLTTREAELLGFTIAGEDRHFFWAEARIERNEVVCQHPDVRHPAAVRYAMTDGTPFTLTNRADLPAGPFRTDDWSQDIPPLEERAAVALRAEDSSTEPTAAHKAPDAASNFRIRHSYRPAAAETAVVFTWDDECLHAKAHCAQPMADLRVHAQDFNDPAIWSDDNIQILIDADRDRQTYFRLAVNPRGAVAAGRGFNDSSVKDRLVHQGLLPHFRGFSLDWESNFAVHTATEANAWTVELSIPWTALGFASAPAAGTVMGLQVTRWHAAGYERSEWQTTGRDYHVGAMMPPCAVNNQQLHHCVSRFGELRLTRSPNP